MQRKKLVVGIDPGTTLGYAVFDLDGNVVAIDSSKELDLNSLITKIISYGQPILVGTDKKNVPGLVEKFATKTGAKMVCPKEDLLTADKFRETKPFVDKFSNAHEVDAIASALVCFSFYRDLFNKIEIFVERNKKEQIKDDIKEIVIKHGLSIKTAADMIEHPEDESVKIIRKAVEKKVLKEEDFAVLFSKLKKAEEELGMLRKQKNELAQKEESARRKAAKLNEKFSGIVTDEKAEKSIKEKERRLLQLYDNMEKIAKENSHLRDEINRLNYIIGGVSQRVLLKKLDNLSWTGFTEKNNILRMEKGDILLVEEPSITSGKLTEFLKNKVQIIITKRPISKKVSENLGFVFIDGSKMDIEETKNFATVNKQDFEAAKRKIDVLQKIVMDYRRERTKENKDS